MARWCGAICFFLAHLPTLIYGGWEASSLFTWFSSQCFQNSVPAGFSPEGPVIAQGGRINGIATLLYSAQPKHVHVGADDSCSVSRHREVVFCCSFYIPGVAAFDYRGVVCRRCSAGCLG